MTAIYESLESRFMLSSVPVACDIPDLPISDVFRSAQINESLQPLDQTFLLHSNVEADHTIYLDFDGHVTQDTMWNSYTGLSQIVTPVFDFDGNIEFSNSELERVQNVFYRVAEDFAPFDVDVTTAEPNVDDLIKSGSNDTRWGVRVVIGGSSSDWYGTPAGGLAYVGSFNWSSDAPCFVFEAQLGNGNEKYVAEAISHETGHTVGLYHDGLLPSTEYYTGHGSGETRWAPIMGSSYYNNLTQWSKGEYTGATQTQDDLNIITTNNGFGYRIDDHSDTTNQATGLSGPTILSSGIIEKNTDVDVFVFTSGSGLISLDLLPAMLGPNLDIQAELYDATGNLMAQSNQIGILAANLNTDVTAGVYYLHVFGVGKGTPDSGYSDYGSLGQYTISGSITSGYILPRLYVSDANVVESEVQAIFTVSLSDVSDEVISVDVVTVDNSAVAGNDYVVLSQTLVFEPGETNKIVTVNLIDDTTVEETENFFLNLSNASGAVIYDGQGIGTIINDDFATPDIFINDASVNEGKPNKGKKATIKYTNMTFTINLSTVSAVPITIDYTTLNETAIAGEDYVATSGTLVFAPGETTKTITVLVIADKEIEDDETFTIRLTNSDGGVLADDSGLGTILNDDVNRKPPKKK